MVSWPVLDDCLHRAVSGVVVVVMVYSLQSTVYTQLCWPGLGWPGLSPCKDLDDGADQSSDDSLVGQDFLPSPLAPPPSHSLRLLASQSGGGGGGGGQAAIL